MSKLNTWLRAKQKLFLVAVCCVLMVVFVVPGIFNPKPSRAKGGTIFGESVSGKHVYNLARNLLPFFGEDRPKDVEIFAHAWELLIMDREADRCGVTVSDSEIADFLAGTFPASGGGVDEARYADLLQRNGVNRAEYEKTLRLLIRDFKVRAAVRQSVALPEDEAWMWYTHDRQRVKARYVMLDGAVLSRLTSTHEGEIRAFYAQYKDTPKSAGPYGAGYQQPERVKIEYVLASREKFENRAPVADDEILKYYEEHKADYVVAGKKDADTPEAGVVEGEDDATAEEAPVYKPLAEVHSQIEKKLREEAAAKAMEKTMKKVNEAIWKALEVPFGSQEAGAVDLKDIATQFDLTYVETDFFTAEDCEKILPGASELRRRAFNRGMGGIGVVSPRMKADEDEFVFRLLESRPPEPLPFEKVAESVKKHFRLKLAADLAQTLASRAGEAPDFDAAVETIRSAVAELVEDTGKTDGRRERDAFLTLGESDSFERPRTATFAGQVHRYHMGAGLPGNVDSTNFADTAFNLKDGEIGLAVDSEQAPRTFFVLERSAIEFPSREEFEQEKAYVMPRLLSEKRAEVLETWQSDLRRRADPSPDVMKFLELLPHWAG